MTEKSWNIRAPVQRLGSQGYLLLSLVSFGGTVIITRVFLELTGYPKIGGGELHIAHVLWGGLLLFVASLLPLIFANRWVFPLGAFLSGVGVGLFIDEVGKFITMNNNYFYPPAAPIIYALFLMTVLVYVRVRGRPARDPRSEFYRVLEDLTELLDRDLEPSEQASLHQQLRHIASESNEQDFSNLAGTLADFLQSGKIQIAPVRPTYIRRMRAWLQKIEKRLISRWRLRFSLILALTIDGIVIVSEVYTRIFATGDHSFALENLLLAGVARGEIRSYIGAYWFIAHLGLQVVIAILAFFSAGMFLSSREKRAVELGILSMVLSLTMANLLAFFVDQFSAILTALIQLLIFLGLVYYRRRFYPSSPS